MKAARRVLSAPYVEYQNFLGTGYVGGRFFEKLILPVYKGMTTQYECDSVANTYFDDLYGLDQGWRFMFSSIQDEKYLYLSDGRSFNIEITPLSGDSNLKDYTFSDLRLEKEAGTYLNGSVSSAYTLYHKDGRKEFFSGDGKLIGIRDKYGNTIKLVNSTSNGHPKITITDTLGRITTISGQNKLGGHIMTVTLPNSITLKYTVDYLTSPISCRALSKYEDTLNITTNYSYTVNSGICRVFSNQSGTVTNYYVNLTTITHPTGLKSAYEYESVTKNLGSQGNKQCYRLKSRADKVGATVYNQKTYSYSTNNNTGHPATQNPASLSSNFTYKTTVTTTATGVSTTSTFNNKHLMTSAETKKGALKVQDELFEYNADKMPTKITTRSYDNANQSVYMESISLWQYDNKGNTTAAWSPLANGSTS